MLDLTHVFDVFPVLETERCILQDITSDDVERIFRMWTDPQVTRYLAQHPMTSLDQAAERVQRYQTAFQEQTGIIWAITTRTHGDYIGIGLLWKLDKAHHRAELGYLLTPDWWGKGIMTEVASEILDFAFSVMDLHSVEAKTDPDNVGSRRLLEKLGFVLEGYFRENFFDPVKQTFADTTVYSLLKQKWMHRTDE